MVDDRDQLAPRRPIAWVVGERVLVLDSPVDVYAKASFSLCAKVCFEYRAGPGDEPLELGSLCGIKSRGRSGRSHCRRTCLGSGGASSARAAWRMRPRAMSSSSSV